MNAMYSNRAMRKVTYITCFSFILEFASPAFVQTLDSDALLTQLKSIDSIYEAGFTAYGTRLKISRSISDVPPLRKKWRFTMSNGEIAYEEDVIEVLNWKDILDLDEDIPKAEQIGGRGNQGEPMIALRSTYFVGSTAQAKYDFVGRIPQYGVLSPWPENDPGQATSGSLDFDDPDAPTYLFEIKRTLWSLGRGYSEHITNINNVSKQEDGLIVVTAEGTDISFREGAKWELKIDLNAGYMVRSAKLYQMGQNQPIISIANSGIKWYGALCVPEKTEWIDGFVGGRTISNEFKSASSEADVAFLEYAETTMRSPYLLYTDVTDQRMTPELILEYSAGEIFPRGQKDQEEKIVFEQLNSQIENNLSQNKEPQNQEVNSENSEISNIQKTLAEQESSQSIHNIKVIVAWIVLIGSLIFCIVYFVKLSRGK